MEWYKENLRKHSTSNSAKKLQRCYWVVIGGIGRGDLEEVRFMVVLLDGGIYCMLALLWN